MAKKSKSSAAQKVAKAEKTAEKGAVKNSKLTAAQKVAKAEKDNSKAKASKAKNPKGNFFKRFANGFKKFWKDFRGEIKKITWPDSNTVLKNTGIVLVSVAVVCVVIFAIDQGLSFLVELLVKLAKNTSGNAETAAAIMNLISLG